ncbi:MAG: aldehyde ferredoxin oxidoreductase N-terminal domain-containing protein [Dehalococcoidia bacterium]
MTTYGYAGRMLRVDLSSGRVTEFPTSDYASQFLGGRGLAAAIYWSEMPPDAGPFDEESRLIFALGPMCGVPVLGASRWGIFGKSPQSSPPQFCYSNLGGHWGAELKFAGYDGIVVQGKSEKPVYILINNAAVEIKDASELWGKGAVEARETLKTELGKSVRVVAIGPAGENEVVTASLLADNDASASSGLGAVMGSKKLKAVAVKRSEKVLNIARPEELRRLTDYFRSLQTGAFSAWGTDFLLSGPTTKKDPCYGCSADCIRVKYTSKEGATGKYMCQSGMFYLQWSWKHYGEQNEVPFLANRIADQYGLDTWALELMIGWLNRCCKSGIISEESSGLPFSKIGSLEFIDTLIRMIARREGFGEVLAQGMEKAAREIGEKAPELIRHADPYDPRLYITTSLLWAMEPREPIQQLHEVGLLLAQWVSWVKKIEDSYVSSDVLKGIARRFWGSEAAADFTSIEGKALAARLIQDRQNAKEALMVCDWAYPVMAIRESPDHIGDRGLESRILSAVVGNDVSEEELSTVGARIFNLQRAISLREGRRGRADDKLPDEWHEKPLKFGVMDPECLVPDKDGQPVSRIGSIVERKEFEQMKDEYYRIRGWDMKTGLPTRASLQTIGLGDVANDLETRELLRL